MDPESSPIRTSPTPPSQDGVPPAPGGAFRAPSRFSAILAVLAWVVILGLVGFVVTRNVLARKEGPIDVRMAVVTAQLNARYVVGISALHLPGATADVFYAKLKPTLTAGPYSVRLRNAVLAGELAGELAGPKEALRLLAELEVAVEGGEVQPSKLGPRMETLLKKLYTGYQDKPGGLPVLTEEEQAELRKALPWFGDLALAPADTPDAAARERVLVPARRTAFALLTAFGLGCTLLLVGFCVLLLLGTQLYFGTLRGAFRTGLTAGGIYAETFALYFISFGVLGRLLRLLPLPEGSEWGLSAVAALSSLIVLVWPVLRGLSWQQVREDIGWVAGRSPVMEPAYGIGCYLACWPVMLVALALVYGLMLIQKRLGLGDPLTPGGGPSHPIGGIALDATWWTWVQVFFAACVAAPIVEETMFRGVLYRHLRELTARWKKAASIVVSVVVSGFLFAVIHPQGILGVPLLMTLATSFALAREWRGTLIPSICAHGVNNGLATGLLLLVAG